jgi:CDP-diacylglycerol---serine O-phosphatidyltransferase
LDTSWIAFLPVVLFPMAGAYRLARFNVDTEQSHVTEKLQDDLQKSHGFKGVPIPAAGLVVASLPLILWFDNYGFTQVLTHKWVLYAITIILSWLMVSRLPMLALKFSNYSFKDNASRYILLIIAVLAAFAGWIAVPVVFILYVILSIITAKKVETAPKNRL